MKTPENKPGIINISDHAKFKENQEKSDIPKDLGLFPTTPITPQKSKPDKKIVTYADMAEAEALFEKALKIEDIHGDTEEVVSSYKKVLELNPDAAGAAVNLGTIYFKRKQFGYAENLYLQAIKSDPKYPLAYFNLGNLNDELGRYPKAIEYYEEAIKINPKYGDALFNLGLRYDKMGNYMSALSAYQRFVKLPEVTEIWRKTANEEIAKIKKKVTL